MSVIFDEQRMQQVLAPCLPPGETLLAGIHGVGFRVEIKETFGPCVLSGSQIIPKPDGAAVQVHKRKAAKFDMYVGITEHFLVLSPCEPCGYLYECNVLPNQDCPRCHPLDHPISVDDVGLSFPLAGVQRCEVRDSWMGSVICSVTFQSGTFLKMMLPRRGGVGNGMPNHFAYREAILSCLGEHAGQG